MRGFVYAERLAFYSRQNAHCILYINGNVLHVDFFTTPTMCVAFTNAQVPLRDVILNNKTAKNK
jgi:hypothetical protein